MNSKLATIYKATIATNEGNTYYPETEASQIVDFETALANYLTNNDITVADLHIGGSAIVNGNILGDIEVINYPERTTSLYQFAKNEIDDYQSKTDISNYIHFQVTDLTTLEEAFKDCTSLEKLHVDYWNTTNMTSFKSTFENCQSLKTLHVGLLETGKVLDMSKCFKNCSALQELDLSEWTITPNSDCTEMFAGCSNLQHIIGTIHLRDLIPAQAKTMFTGCSSLQSVTFSKLNPIIYGSTVEEIRAYFGLPATCEVDVLSYTNH